MTILKPTLFTRNEDGTLVTDASRLDIASLPDSLGIDGDDYPDLYHFIELETRDDDIMGWWYETSKGAKLLIANT